MLLPGEDIAALRSLIGCIWEAYGGPCLVDAGKGWDSVFLLTRARSVTLSSVRVVAAFEGYDEEYSRLRVAGGAPEQAAAERSGQIYYQLRGRTVREVLLVRDTITELREGEPTFELTTGTGVLIDLGTAAMGVCRGSHHTEALLIDIAAAPRLLDIPDPSSEWPADLVYRYSMDHSRAEMALRALIVQQPPRQGNAPAARVDSPKRRSKRPPRVHQR